MSNLKQNFHNNKWAHTSDYGSRRLLSLVILTLLLLAACVKVGHFSEEMRRERFEKSFEIFQKLEQMQRQDVDILSSMSILEKYRKEVPSQKNQQKLIFVKNMSPKRFQEYKDLLTKAGLRSFVYIQSEPKKRAIRFYEESGLNDFGYTYMEYPPPKVFNSFKECKPIVPSQSCYILLRKNWYMFSERFRLEQENAK